jgi:hypothetical protein
MAARSSLSPGILISIVTPSFVITSGAAVPLLTLFTVPKGFVGETGMIQRNAIGSWTRLGPAVEIILCGADEGTAEAAHELRVGHLPDVRRNEHGTPLLDSVFAAARTASRSPLLAYVNADIILFDDFLDAVKRLPKTHLMIGSRWNVELHEPLEFGEGWDDRVRARVASHGGRADPIWLDFFVFARSSPLVELPPFVVGRPRWDNWMIFRARSLRIPVTDATEHVHAVHQNHDYEHVPGATGDLWYGPEADENHALAGKTPMLSALHATHVMTPRGPRPALGVKYLRARWKTRDLVDGRLERLARQAARLYGMRSSGA